MYNAKGKGRQGMMMSTMESTNIGWESIRKAFVLGKTFSDVTWWPHAVCPMDVRRAPAKRKVELIEQISDDDHHHQVNQNIHHLWEGFPLIYSLSILLMYSTIKYTAGEAWQAIRETWMIYRYISIFFFSNLINVFFNILTGIVSKNADLARKRELTYLLPPDPLDQGVPLLPGDL